MRVYKVTDKDGYNQALLDIIHQTKQGIIEYHIAGTKRVSSYLHNVLDLKESVFIIYSAFSIDPAKKILDIFDDSACYLITNLRISAVYADGKFYNTTSDLCPYGFIDTVDYKTAFASIVVKASDYLTKRLMNKYPSLDTIPETYRIHSEKEILQHARFLKDRYGSVIPSFQVNNGNIYTEKFQLHTVIAYSRASNKDAFIAQFGTAYATKATDMPDGSGRTTYGKLFLYDLSLYYNAVKKLEKHVV